ncbi:podoplanin isoform X6 [Melanerpes formicivorus]|uniref:podoplanin isoform X6 n=1 Tax=Melanerpes formicivorus TaxID=211600 RepID=UPI00358E2C5E
MFIKVQIFIFILGTMPFIALAEEASSALEEESATMDFRDRNDTEYEELPTWFGQLMTTESAVAPAEDSGNSTDYEANTEHADGGLSRGPEKPEKGGLETIALVGIIIGIIVAVGILAGIIIAVVRKMSGRYSP